MEVMVQDDRSGSETEDRAAGQELAITWEWIGRSVVLAVAGEIDMVTSPRFQEEMLASVDTGPETLVVDLTDVGFFDSAGLSALVAVYERATESTTLRVVTSSNATVRPLRVTALDRKIPVHYSREDALRHR